MNNDFEKKTEELIELAEGNAPVVKAEALPVDDIKPKKKSGAGAVIAKILLGIVGVIVLLAAALFGTGCGVISCATADDMPEAPAATEFDTTKFVLDAVTEVITKKTITLNADIINNLLITVKDQVNASTDLIRIDDLFCDLENSGGKLYARVYIGTVEVKGFSINIDKVVPVQADFDVAFDSETKDIIAKIGQITCGKIDIPDVVIDTVLAQISLPEDVTIDADGNIRYNTATLDAMIDEAVGQAITSSVSGALGGLLSDFATNLINVELLDAKIDGENLVISAEVF